MMRRMLPAAWWNSLPAAAADDDPFWQRTFLAIDYEENTRWVTEIEFCKDSATTSQPIAVSVCRAQDVPGNELKFEQVGDSSQFASLAHA